MFLSAFLRIIRLFVLFYAYEVKDTALLVLDNRAEIFIKSQFEQLTLNPRSQTSVWIDVQCLHLKGWAPAMITVFLGISHCCQGSGRAKLSSGLNTAVCLKSTPDSQSDDCVIFVDTIAIFGTFQVSSETECGCGRTISFCADTWIALTTLS